MSQKRKSSQALNELIYRSSIWNGPGLSSESRQALPDAYKRSPEDDPFRREYEETYHSSLFSYSPSKTSLISKDSNEEVVKDKRADFTKEDVTAPWSRFCRESSCHGVKNFETFSRSRPTSILWLLITVGMAGGLLYTVVTLVINYYDYGTVTRTEVLVSDELEFPSITICNICPYKSVDNNGVDNPISALMSKTTIFSASVVLDENDPEYIRTLAMNSLEIQQNYSYTPNELFWFAVYEGKTLNLNDAFEIVNTQYGRCFTFNGPEYIKKHGVRKVTYDGRYSGLRVMSQIWQSKYLVMDDMTAGLRLYIAQHPETPRLDKDGIDIHPGTATKIALAPTKSKFLPAPYTSYGSERCQETEKMDLTNKMYDAPFYSYTACIDQCQDYHASMNCSCYTATLQVKNLPPCTVEQDFFCFKGFKNQIINNRITVECDCPRPCSSYGYTTTISSSQMPSRVSSSLVLALLGRQKDELELLRDDYVDVRIYLESDKVREEVHEPEYTFNSMLAYLGGQMGFFLGASLVTVTELVETICFWLYTVFRRKVVGMGQMEGQPEKKEAGAEDKEAGKEPRKY